MAVFQTCIRLNIVFLWSDYKVWRWRQETSSSFGRAIRTDPVPHRSIPSLSLVPHSQQLRVAGIHEIDDAHVRLAHVFEP
jgi:hypothetical protein